MEKVCVMAGKLEDGTVMRLGRLARAGVGWLAFFVAASLVAQPYGLGPYAPAHFYPGSSAIRGVLEDGVNPLFQGWATEVVSVSPGGGLDFREYPPYAYPPSNVLGVAMTPRLNDPFDVLPLGRGGSVVVTFARPIRNGPGYDFAVFENGADAFFLELAWVEVSSDGENYVRFPNHSLTPNPVGAFQVPAIDPTRISGFASKYAAGYGTPFDLSELPGGEEIEWVRYVRLVDVVGDGTARDSSGRVIYDPYRTVLTAGFDLDAVGVLHEPLGVDLELTGPARARLSWAGSARSVWSEKNGAEWILHNEALVYVVERRRADGTWEEMARLSGSNGVMSWEVALEDQSRGIFQVREEGGGE